MREEYDFSQGKRGPVIPPQSGKTRITIRIDTDILDWFRQKVHEAGGGNYQTMINDALRQHIKQQDNTPRDILDWIIMTNNVIKRLIGKQDESIEENFQLIRDEIRKERNVYTELSKHLDES